MIDWFNPKVTPDEEQNVAAFMGRLAALPVPGTGIAPNHRAIWWKAQLLRRWDEQRQAVRPVALMEPVQLVAGLTAAALVFLWALPSLTRAVSGVIASVRPIA